MDLLYAAVSSLTGLGVSEGEGQMCVNYWGE